VVVQAFGLTYPAVTRRTIGVGADAERLSMRLLLTGVAGFAGAHILQHLLENTDWEIVGIASWKHKGTPERVHQVLSKEPCWPRRVAIVTHDLESPLTERTLARIGALDAIINAAAESHVDRSIADPVPFIENNVGVALNMLELARRQAATLKVFVQVSTDEVYGAAPDGVRHAEWSPIVPSNPYSASKAAQEAIAISYWRTFAVPLIITNTMNIFGEMQDPEKYIAKIIRAVAKGEVVTVHGGAEGIGSRFYMHGRNHADALLFILRNVTPILHPGADRPLRYNVVGEKEIDNLALARMIAAMMGKPLRYEIVDFHSTRPGHDRRYALDGSRIHQAGWTAPFTFEESLRRSIAWTLAHPEWL
jgi:dTDP-glucose 4,6-dehydratase